MSRGVVYYVFYLESQAFIFNFFLSHLCYHWVMKFSSNRFVVTTDAHYREPSELHNLFF
ncbi:hypothetical protein PROVRETT_10076 [Providencia rettgeri DSM 1131]|nr:hypothetical protein PROVRETT_10076 [Providencia rettgeri DSM 1131]